MPSFIVDSNVLVGLADRKDHRHADSERLVSALVARGMGPIYLDFIVAEAASVICRRAAERRRGPASKALDTLRSHIPEAEITWASVEIPRLWGDVWAVIVESAGALNFNDALIVCLLRETLSDGIATLDDDFDGLPGVMRFSATA